MYIQPRERPLRNVVWAAVSYNGSLNELLEFEDLNYYTYVGREQNMGRDDPFQHMFAKQHSQNSIRELPSTTYVHVQCILCVQACRDEIGTVSGSRMRDFVSHNALTARGVCLSLSPSPSSLSPTLPLSSLLPPFFNSLLPLSPYSSYLGRGIQDYNIHSQPTIFMYYVF